MESRGRVEGEIGSLSENMERELRREGSWKVGSSVGLESCKMGDRLIIGEVSGGVADEVRRVGKCSTVKGGGSICKFEHIDL